MYRLTILYGMPQDPEGFRRYYYDTHIPLAQKMKGLTGWNLSWTEPGPDGVARYVLIAELYAPDREALEAVLASPEGQAANADLTNFVTDSVDFVFGAEEQVPLEEKVRS